MTETMDPNLEQYSFLPGRMNGIRRFKGEKQ